MSCDPRRGAVVCIACLGLGWAGLGSDGWISGERLFLCVSRRVGGMIDRSCA